MVGPICAKCGKRIDPMTGHYHAFNDKKDPFQIDSFHISQLMIAEEGPWQNMYAELQKPLIDTQTVYNEILGHPYDSNDQPITKSELQAVCNPDLKNCFGGGVGFPPKKGPRVLGVDTGLGIKSYTVISLLEIQPNGKPPTLLGMKKYEKTFEQDSRYYTKDIAMKAKQYKCDLVSIDWGNSQHDIPELRKMVRSTKIGVNVMMGVDSPRRWWFDPTRQVYKHSRTLCLTSVFAAIRNRQIELFNWGQFEYFGKDFLAEFIDYSSSGPNRGKMFYNHTQPDDALFSFLYSYIGAEILSYSKIYFSGLPR